MFAAEVNVDVPMLDDDRLAGTFASNREHLSERRAGPSVLIPDRFPIRICLRMEHISVDVRINPRFEPRQVSADLQETFVRFGAAACVNHAALRV